MGGRSGKRQKISVDDVKQAAFDDLAALTEALNVLDRYDKHDARFVLERVRRIIDLALDALPAKTKGFYDVTKEAQARAQKYRPEKDLAAERLKVARGRR